MTNLTHAHCWLYSAQDKVINPQASHLLTSVIKMLIYTNGGSYATLCYTKLAC